jgi:hypothetical protein
MELVSIFVEEKTGEGIYAIKNHSEEQDEFERNLNLWSDTEYIINYLEVNKRYLESEYFRDDSIDSLLSKIKKETIEIEKLMVQKAQEGFNKSGESLQQLFKPLNNWEYQLFAHQESKAVISNHHFPKPILRMYAIRIAENTFVITGGAIKLVHQMEDHDDTSEELKKLKNAKAFLVESNLITEEDIKLFLNDQS